MKAIGVVGSPRKDGNTEIITRHTLAAIEEEGLTTELIRLTGLDIRPCNACMGCRSEEMCPIDDDLFPLYAKLKDSEGIILASPVYYGSATALLKAFMERVGFIGGRRKVFVGKVGGTIGCSPPRWAEFCIRPDYVLVSHPRILYARFNLLEHSIWPRKGRS